MRARGFLPFLVLALLPSLLGAEGKADSAYVVAVAAFSADSREPVDSLFLSALPRLILAGLIPLPPRLEGRDYFAEAATREASAKLYEKGAALYASLDELALRQLEPGPDSQDRRNRVAAAMAKALAARAALDLGSAKPAKPQKPSGPVASASKGEESLRVVLHEDNLKGELLPAVGAYPGAAIRGKKISLLIHGKVGAIGDYVSVEVMAFDTALARDLASFKVYGDPADPGPLAREIVARLASLVAGRDFARITVKTSPDSATVTPRGQGIYSQDRTFFAFDSGSLGLEIKAPGYQSLEKKVDYLLGDSITVTVELLPASLGQVRVETLPPGLPVFLDGLPLGLSPLVASLVSSSSVLASSDAQGGQAEAVVSPLGPDTLVLIPNQDSKTRGKLIQSKRDKFYSALGLFVVSLPVTTLAYGLNSMYYDAAYRSGDSGLANLYYLSSLGLGGSAALSAGFAVNAVICLVRYISSTD